MTDDQGYTEIHDSKVANDVCFAFGLDAATKDGDNRCVRAGRSEAALLIMARSDDLLKKFIMDDKGQITLEEIFMGAGLQRKTVLSADGKVGHFNQNYQSGKGLTGKVRHVPITDSQAEAWRKMLEAIGVWIVPKVHPLIGPDRPPVEPKIDRNKIIYG